MSKKRQYQGGGIISKSDRISAIENDPSNWNIDDYIKFKIPEPGLGVPLINTDDIASIAILGTKLGVKGIKYAGEKFAKSIADDAAKKTHKLGEKLARKTGDVVTDDETLYLAGKANQKFRGGRNPDSYILKNNPQYLNDDLTHRILNQKNINYLKSDLSKQEYGGYLPNKALGGGLQGAVAGAGTGAAIGAPFGGIGAPIGAGIGFLVGGAAGWISEDEQIKQQRAQEDAARLAQQKQQEFIKSLNQQQPAQTPTSIPNVMNYGYRTNFKHGGNISMAPYHNVSQEDYDRAYNAEGGEIIEDGNQGTPQPIGDQGGVKQIAPGASKVMGPSHAGGGVDLSGGAYVFSDKLKTSDGNTFAKEAEGLYKQFNEAHKLYSKSNDRFMKTAYTRTIGKIQKKLNDLRAEQEQERGADETLNTMKGGGWIAGAVASIKKNKTEGICSGSNYGGKNCPPGSKRYALAQTFRKMARNKEDGGFVDPVKEKEYNMLKSKLVKMALGGSLSKTNKTPLKQMADGGGLAYAGMAANAIGPIYDIAQSFRKTEPVNYPRISVSNVNYGKSIQEQVSELDRQREAAVSAARNNAISSQEYLQMVRAIDSDIAIKKQRAISGGREQEANVNAQMANQIGAQNAQIGISEQEARSKALGERQTAGRVGAYGIGDTLNTAAKDILQFRQNEDTMNQWGNYMRPRVPQQNTNLDMYESLYPSRMPGLTQPRGVPYNVPSMRAPQIPDFDISQYLVPPGYNWNTTSQFPQ